MISCFLLTSSRASFSAWKASLYWLWLLDVLKPPCLSGWKRIERSLYCLFTRPAILIMPEWNFAFTAQDRDKRNRLCIFRKSNSRSELSIAISHSASSLGLFLFLAFFPPREIWSSLSLYLFCCLFFCFLFFSSLDSFDHLVGSLRLFVEKFFWRFFSRYAFRFFLFFSFLLALFSRRAASFSSFLLFPDSVVGPTPSRPPFWSSRRPSLPFLSVFFVLFNFCFHAILFRNPVTVPPHLRRRDTGLSLSFHGKFDFESAL